MSSPTKQIQINRKLLVEILGKSTNINILKKFGDPVYIIMCHQNKLVRLFFRPPARLEQNCHTSPHNGPLGEHRGEPNTAVFHQRDRSPNV